MPKVNYFLICENTVTDKTGKMTIVNSFESITTQRLPIVCPKFVVAMDISLTTQELESLPDPIPVEIKIYGPKQEVLLSVQGKTKHQPDKNLQEARIISSLDLTGDFKISQEKTHSVQLFVDGASTAVTTFAVELASKKKGKK